MDKLLELYKVVLGALFCDVDENTGVVTERSLNNLTDSNYVQPPVVLTIDGVKKTLVLPMKKVLMGNFTELVAFHPGCESYLGGQSEVITWMQIRASIVVKFNIAYLVNATLAMLQQPNDDMLNLQQRKFIEGIKGSNALYEYTKKVLVTGLGVSAGKFTLSRFHLDRLKEIDGVKYGRVCKFVTVLDQPDPLCDIKNVSEPSTKALRHILSMIIPNGITVGTNSKDAPYFMVLMEAYYDVASSLNAVRKKLGEYTGVSYSIPTEYWMDINSLPQLKKQFLPQPYPGNQGIVPSPTAGVGNPAKVDDSPPWDVLPTDLAAVEASNRVLPVAPIQEQVRVAPPVVPQWQGKAIPPLASQSVAQAVVRNTATASSTEELWASISRPPQQQYGVQQASHGGRHNVIDAVQVQPQRRNNYWDITGR